MQIIQSIPNPSGAYPSPQSWESAAIPAEYSAVADDLDLTGFYNAMGFITPVFSGRVMTGYGINHEALSAWKSEHPEIPDAEAAPTDQEQMRADIDYLAAMTGIEL